MWFKIRQIWHRHNIETFLMNRIVWIVSKQRKVVMYDFLKFSNLSTGLRYRSASNTKLFLPLIRFYSLPVHITFAISLPSSLPDPLGCRHWSLSFTHKLSRISKSLTALFGMRHLTYGTNFLLLFAFLVSRPPQSALLQWLKWGGSAPCSHLSPLQ